MHEIPANLLRVAKKRSRNPTLRAFGAWLEQLRGKQSRERISMRLSDRGASLGGSTLAQYEKGTVWAPDVVVLSGLAEIYGVSFEHLVRAVAMNRMDASIHRDALIARVLASTSAPDKSGSSRADSEHGRSSEMARVSANAAAQDPQAQQRGETAHGAEPEGTATRRRREQAQHVIDAVVEHEILSHRQAAIEEYARQLYASADSVRAVADALRGGAQPPTARGTRSVPSGGRPSLHPKPSRRRGA
jgi:hypothetical protein